ncbi:hypothetical protein BB934_32605 (plasmid) [Microvirga ossetica]|uniref:Uncharacterized protein n=1 Tax=Microvirga ossetica TaxID=1882682 RepID=A0A1B2ET11_9HYPH|nr:hypothetical protein BB934_32605 [Microvirga ossetica]
MDQGETPSQIRPIEGDGEEEAQGRNRRVQLGGVTPLSVRCNWKCRTSSGEAVSGERPRKAAKLLT